MDERATLTADDIYLTVRAFVWDDWNSDAKGFHRRTALDRRNVVRHGIAAACAVTYEFHSDLDLLHPWIAFDGPNGVPGLVGSDELAMLGLDSGEAFRQAWKNTRSQLEAGWVSIVDGGVPGTFAAHSQNPARAAGLLMTPAIFEPWRDRVPGELLILPGANDDIVLVGSEAENLAEAVVGAVGAFERRTDRRLSPIPYVLAADRLRPLQSWVPPPGSPVAAEIRHADVIQRVTAYNDTQFDLQASLEQEDRDRLVAVAQSGVNASTGEPFSFCLATFVGPLQLLPFVDYVGFENVDPQRRERVWLSMNQLRDLPVMMFPTIDYVVPMFWFEPPETDEDAGPQSSAMVAAAQNIALKNPPAPLDLALLREIAAQPDSRVRELGDIVDELCSLAEQHEALEVIRWAPDPEV